MLSRSKWRTALPSQPLIRNRQVVEAPAVSVRESGASRRPASCERRPSEPGTASIIGGAPWPASAMVWLPKPAARGGDLQAVLERRGGAGGGTDRGGRSRGERESG